MPFPKIDFTLGPFVGMRYISDFKNWEPGYVLEAQDAFPTPDGAYAVRTADNAVSPTGASASAAIQGEIVFEQSNGTNLDVLILNGEIWGRTTNDFTKRVTAANLAATSITLNATGRVYLVIFDNTVVVTDGTNTPFTWDGTTGAGGLVKLTNAPVAYGPPSVYYAKLFFVKNSERDTLSWSEELSANTGYEAGGFNNTWQLRQSGSGPLHRILGRNEALYYWRQHSIGSIRGSVSTDFTAAGVHDDISEEVGTTAPESVLEYEGYIWFADAEGRPYRFAPGGRLEPIWKNIAAAFVYGGTDKSPGSAIVGERAFDLVPATIARTYAAPFPFHRAVVYAWQQSSQSSLHQNAIAFGVEGGEALCKLTVQAITDFRGSHLAAGLHPSLDYPCLVYGGLKSADNTVQLVSFGSPVSAYKTGVSCRLYTPAFQPEGDTLLQGGQLDVGLVLGPGAPTTALCSVTATVSPNAGFNRPTTHYSALPGTAILSALSAPSHRVTSWGLDFRRQRLRPSFQVIVDTTGSAQAGVQSIRLASWAVPRHPKVTGA